jgi:hypothetical protein
MQVPLKLRITYGSFVVGKGTESTYRIKRETFEIRRDRLTSSVNFTLIVLASSYATLETLSAELEAYRDRQKRLTIEIYDVSSYVTVQDYDNTGNVSKNSLSNYTMLSESRFRTGYSREYAVSIEIDLPPREANGRTELGCAVSFDEARMKVVTIRVQYNATSSGTAKNRYEADCDTYCTEVLAVFGGTYDLPQETLETPNAIINTEYKVSRTYQEIIFNQMSGTLQDPQLIGFHVSVSRTKSNPGQYQGQLPESVPGGANGRVVPLTDIVVRMSTRVDKTLTTDLKGKYDSTLRAYLLSYAKTLMGVTLIAIVSENLDPDPVTNSLHATLTLSCAERTGQVYSASLTTRINEDYGIELVKAADGSKHGYYKIQVAGSLTRAVIQSVSVIGQGGKLHLDPFPFLAPEPAAKNEDGWQILGREYTDSPQLMGYVGVGAESLPVFSSSTSRNEQYVTSVGSIGGSSRSVVVERRRK